MITALLTVACSTSAAGGFQEPVLEIVGRASSFGVAVAGGGDVDADGVPDFIVGAYDLVQQMPQLALAGTARPTPGSVQVFSGRDGRVLHDFAGESSDHGFGLDVADAGDVNGDGHSDVLVAAPYVSAQAVLTARGKPGLAHVYSGKDGSRLATLEGPSTGIGHVVSVSPLGDQNGDGHADVVVAYGYLPPVAGSVVAYSGRDWSVLFRLEGAEGEVRFAESIGNAGDIDGDRVADVIVGAGGAVGGGRDRGVAKVFSGKTGSLIHAWTGEVDFAAFGSSVAGIGDVDRDGRSDLLVCAPRLGRKSAHSGGAFVYSGKAGTLLFALDGPGKNTEFGTDCCALGDVNGDTCPDFAVAAWRESGEVPRPGRTRVYSGMDGSLLFDCPGTAVGCAGDVDSDGFVEVVTGVLGEVEPGVARIFSVRLELPGAATGR